MTGLNGRGRSRQSPEPSEPLQALDRQLPPGLPAVATRDRRGVELGPACTLQGRSQKLGLGQIAPVVRPGSDEDSRSLRRGEQREAEERAVAGSLNAEEISAPVNVPRVARRPAEDIGVACRQVERSKA